MLPDKESDAASEYSSCNIARLTVERRSCEQRLEAMLQFVCCQTKKSMQPVTALPAMLHKYSRL